MVQIGSGHRQRFGRVRQVGEHHRRGQHVHRVILPTETRVEQAGDDVRALEIEIIPHALAQQRIRVLSAFEIRGVAEEPCQNRADHRAQPQFGDRVLFRNVVDADLCRSGATHHARTELSDTSQVGGHRLVPVLRIDGNVRVTGFRLVTIVDESETKFFEDGVDFAAERARTMWRAPPACAGCRWTFPTVRPVPKIRRCRHGRVRPVARFPSIPCFRRNTGGMRLSNASMPLLS